jgi:hypothetical protein
MAAVPKAGLQATISTLNRVYGFGVGPRVGASGKMIGKGFILYQAYGKNQIQYVNFAKNSGRENVTGLHSRGELNDMAHAMIKAIMIKKGR